MILILMCAHLILGHYCVMRFLFLLLFLPSSRVFFYIGGKKMTLFNFYLKQKHEVNNIVRLGAGLVITVLVEPNAFPTRITIVIPSVLESMYLLYCKKQYSSRSISETLEPPPQKLIRRFVFASIRVMLLLLIRPPRSEVLWLNTAVEAVDILLSLYSAFRARRSNLSPNKKRPYHNRHNR